jgi:RNA polymerase sigma-70 factor, ECF subfamily
LNCVLGERSVAEDAVRDAVCERAMRVVQLREGPLVAVAGSLEQRAVGICVVSHMKVDHDASLAVTVRRVGGRDAGVAASAMTEEARLVRTLRDGDESAFVQVVDRYTPAMLRLARVYGLGSAAAEDAVQETWVRVLRSLDRFEERSSFRTWLFAILGNCARGRAEADRRTMPIGAFEAEPVADEARFFPGEHPRWAGMWTTLVDSWESVPEERLLAAEVRSRFRESIDALPARYAAVFVLRDVEGWSSDEVCVLLDLSPENQRVLLHRARTRLRAILEEYLKGEAA